MAGAATPCGRCPRAIWLYVYNSRYTLSCDVEPSISTAGAFTPFIDLIVPVVDWNTLQIVGSRTVATSVQTSATASKLPKTTIESELGSTLRVHSGGNSFQTGTFTMVLRATCY